MGRGILMVLANVAVEDEAEFNRWYDREHIRERVEIPGFLSAQRYVSTGDAPWKYLALYETETLDILRSPAYERALSNQSAWSKSTLAKFRDPQRCVAERTYQRGYGTGAAISLTRIRPKPRKVEELRTALASELIPGVLKNNAVIEATLMECDPVLSRPLPEYPKGIERLRPDDWFVTVHAFGAEQARVEIPDWVRTDLVDTIEPIGGFKLLWDLHRSDL